MKRKYYGILVLSLLLILGGCKTSTPQTIPETTEVTVATPLAKHTDDADAPPSEPTATSSPADPDAPISIVGFTPDGDPFQGNPNASVIIEEFSSYQCPFCTRYVQQTYPRIHEEYVATGLILYIFHDYPLPGQTQSPLAAEAANCAGDIAGAEAYWHMHDYLFLEQQAWSKNRTLEVLKAQAAKMDLDTDAFATCLDNHTTRKEVEADTQIGSKRGVRGTPTFFINGQPLVGAQPFEAFAEVIDPLIVAGGGDVAIRPTPRTDHHGRV